MAKEITTETKASVQITEDQFERLLARLSGGNGLSAEQLSTVLAENAKATRKALRPENERHPDISAFNPAGERDHPRPKLIHDVILSGMPLSEDELTVGEIELLNSFTHTRVARNGQWKAEVRTSNRGGKSELVISIPVATMDDRMSLPNGMSLILTELLGGEQATDPATLASRVAELEARLAKTA